MLILSIFDKLNKYFNRFFVFYSKLFLFTLIILLKKLTLTKI